MSVAARSRAAWGRLQWRALRVRQGRCPFCGPTALLLLDAGESGIRCPRCAACAVHLSLGCALAPLAARLPGWQTYELSSHGPVVEWLRRRCRGLALSESLDDALPGAMRDGVRCEDVQRLTWEEGSFDLVTHTEVVEHVPDDAAGWRELLRVRRPGGTMLFTVPLSDADRTVERAQLRDGVVRHRLPPTWHSDRLRGAGKVLCFRDYGRDIVARVAAAGFTQVALLRPDARVPWNAGRAVIAARKPA